MGTTQLDDSFENSLDQTKLSLFENYSVIKEKNGDKYIGEIKDKQKHGYGILFYSNHDKYIKYEGFWKHNQKHRKGTMIYKDDSIYIGQWKNDMRDGEGELYYSSGEKYCGNFKEDKKNGKGFFYSKNYNNIFYGNFKDDVKDGKGITFYKKNNKRSKELWKNGVIISCKVEKNKNNSNNNDDLNKDNADLFEFSPKLESKNRNNSLNLIKYYKASIPNNFFDIMNLVIITYALLYDNGEIKEWKENNVIKLLDKIGIENKKYNDIILNNQINGTKFLKLTLNDLKDLKINDVKDSRIILKSINFLREFYTRYVDYNDEYEKAEENKVVSQENLDKNKMLKINSSMNRKRSSKLIFTFSKERIESTESLSKMNKITEEDIIGNSSADSDEEIYIKDNHGLNMKNEYLIRTPGKKESVKFQRRENKSHTIKAFDESKKKADNKNKKKENIENVAFTITKMSITNLFIQSLFRNGFDFYIPFDEIEKGEEILQDDICFQMFVGKWQGKKIVIKSISIDRIKNEINNKKKYSKLNIGDIIQNFIKEINICNNLRHPNIVLFIGVSINKNEFYQIFEYIENHTLYELLHKNKKIRKTLKTLENNIINKNQEEKNKNKIEVKNNIMSQDKIDNNAPNLYINDININDNNDETLMNDYYKNTYDIFHNLEEIIQEKILFQIAYEITIALRYIHSRNIIHCDLKTSNILLDEEYHVKLSNFFHSKIINFFSEENKEEEYFLNSKNEWTPPEVLINGKFEDNSDIYELGLVLYEIFTGEIPHKSMGSNQIIGLNNILMENDITNKLLVNLIKKCLSEDPKNRPSLEYISNFLQKICIFLDKKESTFEELGNFMLN